MGQKIQRRPAHDALGDLSPVEYLVAQKEAEISSNT